MDRGQGDALGQQAAEFVLDRDPVRFQLPDPGGFREMITAPSTKDLRATLRSNASPRPERERFARISSPVAALNGLTAARPHATHSHPAVRLSSQQRDCPNVGGSGRTWSD